MPKKRTNLENIQENPEEQEIRLDDEMFVEYVKQNLATMETPKEQELRLDHEMFVEYLKKNLAIVNADTAQKAAELERLQKVKKQLLDYNYGCVSTASEDPYPEKENLLPSLNQVNSKAEELVGQLGELLGAKCNVHQAYDEHCQEVKSVTAEQLKTRYDQYSTMKDADLGKAIDEAKESMQETLDKTAAKKSELANKKKEHQAKHSAMMKEIETLNHVEQDAIERLEQLRLKEALGN